MNRSRISSVDSEAIAQLRLPLAIAVVFIHVGMGFTGTGICWSAPVGMDWYRFAGCPNIHECWGSRRTATFMILGAVCTRACRFCAVKTGLPNELDLAEPERVADSVVIMNLKHVVVTAVARDDLKDGGSEVFAETIRAIRRKNPFTTIEVLPSDMGGIEQNIRNIIHLYLRI